MTGGPIKEQETDKPSSIGRIQKRSKGDATHPTTSQNPPHWTSSWLSDVHATRKDSGSHSDWQRQPGNEPHHHKTPDCESCGRAVLLSSLILLLPTQVPFPDKVSCFVSTGDSLDNSLLSVGKSPPSGSGWGGPSCNTYYKKQHNLFKIMMNSKKQLLISISVHSQEGTCDQSKPSRTDLSSERD